MKRVVLLLSLLALLIFPVRSFSESCRDFIQEQRAFVLGTIMGCVILCEAYIQESSIYYGIKLEREMCLECVAGGVEGMYSIDPVFAEQIWVKRYLFLSEEGRKRIIEEFLFDERFYYDYRYKYRKK